MQIKGTTALVAGGSQGIGLGIALSLAERGAKHIILLARREGPLRAAAEQLERRGAKATICTVDVGDGPAVEAALEALRRVHGLPDLIVCSAASGRFVTLDEAGPADMDEALRGTCVGAFHLCRAFYKDFLARDAGAFVIVGSPVHAIGFPAITYKASRHAVHGFAEALASDLRHTNVRVTYAEPARIDGGTYFDNNAGVEPRLPWIQRTPRLRMLWQSPQEAGAMVVRAAERGRFHATPLYLRALQLLLPRPLLTWTTALGGTPAAAGGFPDRRRTAARLLDSADARATSSPDRS